MWLFCEAGFFSLVRKGGGPDTLQVRTRCARDLVNLRQWCPGLGTFTHTPNADYAYRALVSRQDFAAALSQMVMDVDYDNFKDMVARQGGGVQRMSVYHRIWGLLADWQASLLRPRRGRGTTVPRGRQRELALEPRNTRGLPGELDR